MVLISDEASLSAFFTASPPTHKALSKLIIDQSELRGNFSKGCEIYCAPLSLSLLLSLSIALYVSQQTLNKASAKLNRKLAHMSAQRGFEKVAT